MVRTYRGFNLGLIGLVAGLLSVLAMGLPAGSSAQRPSWDLSVVGGGHQALADWRGYIVVAAFGATWCPPCRVELPALESLAKEYQGKKVKVMWISIDNEEVSDGALTQFVNRLGVHIPVLRDLKGAAFAQFRQSSIPLLVVIDRQGNVVGKPEVGFSDRVSFLQKVRRLIRSAGG